MKKLLIPLLISAAFCASNSLASVTNIVNFTATVFVQNTTTDSGTTTVTAPPVKKRVTTKDILGFLAQGIYGWNAFPADARLALISNGPSYGYFVVVDKQLNVLANVSDVMTFTAGENIISSGKVDQYAGLMRMRGLELATITFDNTPILGDIQFSIRGLLSGSIIDTPGVETQNAVITSAVGEGTFQGIPLVLTANLSFRGKGPI